MKNVNNQSYLKKAFSTVALSMMFFPAVALADSANGHNEGHMTEDTHMSGEGHMMEQSNMANQNMDQHMREVMGTGRINKVMADKHMVNIVHEPIAEMDWPKMRMNFKTDESVNLDELKPGQEVSFTLQVNKDNSYVIKQIDVK